MQIINVQASTTAELVAFYNAYSGNAIIKKFADRKTAERRVQSLIDAQAPKAEEQEEVAAPSTEVAVVEQEEVQDEEEVSSDEEETEEEEAARLEAEAAADTEQAPKRGTSSGKTTHAAQRRSNSAGVAASWADPSVHAARLIRDGVSVTVDGHTTTHRSTREAFRSYRLPDSMHIRFRLKLKEARKAVFTFEGVEYHFEIN